MPPQHWQQMPYNTYDLNITNPRTTDAQRRELEGMHQALLRGVDSASPTGGPLDEFENARRQFSPQLNIGAESAGLPAFMPMGDGPQNLMQQSPPQVTPTVNAPAIRVSAASLPTTTGPMINNGGTLSNSFERAGDMSRLPNGGWISQVHDRPGGYNGAASPSREAPALDPAAQVEAMILRARQSASGSTAAQEAGYRATLPNLMQQVPDMERNRLAQQGQETDRRTREGYTGPDGTRIRGSNEIANMDADTRRLQAQDQRNAPEVAADQASRRTIAQHMARYNLTGPAGEEQAIRELRALNPAFHVPRPPGSGPLPTPGGSAAPPTAAGAPQSPGAVATPTTASPPTGTPNVQPVQPLPSAERDSLLQRERQREQIERAFRQGIINVPTVPTTDPLGVVTRSPAPLADGNRARYLQAITNTIANLPDEVLQNQWDTPGGIREQLINQSGDPALLAEWQNQNYYTNPFSGAPIGLSNESTATHTQLARMARLNRARTGRAAPSGVPFTEGGMGGPNAIGSFPAAASITPLGSLLSGAGQQLRRMMGTQ